MIYVLIIVFSILLDQFTKWQVLKFIPFGERIEVIEGFFYLTHWKNEGAAWGIFSGQKAFLILTTMLALVFLFFYFQKTSVNITRFAIVIIVGGALGNFIDRLFREGGVVDFLLLTFGDYTFPAFNFADSIIVCSTILLFFCVVFEEKLKKKVEL